MLASIYFAIKKKPNPNLIKKNLKNVKLKHMLAKQRTLLSVIVQASVGKNTAD